MSIRTLSPTPEIVAQAVEAGAVALWASGLEDETTADEVARAVVEAALPVLLGRAPSPRRRTKNPKHQDLNELFWECGHLREPLTERCRRCGR